nr:hypothetical protein [Lymantria dispar multiple nucleopolyhedrovirus]QCQ67434.1 hypothetical protein [Lymantria dispar multiple nucleopolyhedrovirus]QCQ67593.1 hypothetical protein [Lymantria dispar multiple nucleopolyhedrovirus]
MIYKLFISDRFGRILFDKRYQCPADATGVINAIAADAKIH